MTPVQWERAKEIFDVALSLDADKRTAYVRSACSADSTVFSEVESLLAAHEEMPSDGYRPDWFRPPTPPAPSLRSGEVISGRFRIIRQLGKGGMGEVYEAHDSELGVQVALKTLHPEIAANPEVLKRFRQEVRIAHSITHSNVCRTFHLDREIGHVGPDGSGPVNLTFITMELLEGKTLQQLLKDTGRLSLDRAHSIAIQMAEAIEEAHHNGVIHRDIKPGNVMICPGKNGEAERVVITDFGLAKIEISNSGPNPELSAISHPGHAIGTLAYMAPEQLDGRPVSPATDIYAFGLVLYEMVTGKKAFPDITTYPAACRRLTEAPPSPRAVVRTLPVAWERAILACLKVDPADRLQHATRVIDAIEGAKLAELQRPPVSGHSGRSNRPPAPSRSNTGRRWRITFAVAILFCVSLSWPAYRLYQSRANATVAPGTLVYLAPVKNETGEKQLDNITELVRAGLSQSAQINLLDAGRVADTLQRMTKPADTVITDTVAREIAMRAGAPRVVISSLSLAQGKYTLAVEIDQPDNSPGRARHTWNNSWTWEKAALESGKNISPKLLEAIRDSSDWTRHEVGESAEDIVRLGVPPEDVTTGSWDALEDFVHAQTLAQQNQPANSVLALKDAVREDSQFALAYATMGDRLLSLHRELEGFQAYDRALDASLRNRLTRREEDRIRGMRAVDSADYELAVDTFRDYTINYKDDYIGWVYPTKPLRLLNRDEEAIANLRKAIKIEPLRPFAPYELAIELTVQGHQSEALNWIDYLRKEGEGETAGNAEILIDFLNHRYDHAAGILHSFQKSASPMQRSESYAELASLAAENGKYKEAMSYLEQAKSEDDAQSNTEQSALHLLDRAYIECKLHQLEQSIKDVHSGYALNPIPRNALLADTILGNVGAEAPPSLKPTIRLELLNIQHSLAVTGYGNLSIIVNLRTRGELQLVEGKPEEAVKIFEEAAIKDAPETSKEYLARSLVAASARSSDTKAARNQLQQALAAYSTISLKPALVWCDPNQFLPGAYADELGAYLDLATRLNVSSQEVRESQSNYSKLRKKTP